MYCSFTDVTTFGVRLYYPYITLGSGKVDIRDINTSKSVYAELSFPHYSLSTNFIKDEFMKVSMHSSNEDFCFETPMGNTPRSDDSSLSSDETPHRPKSKFPVETNHIEGALSDIKEEEDDYEKDFLPYLGTAKISFSNIEPQTNETTVVETRQPIQIEVSGSQEDDDIDSDSYNSDDGVGIGEKVSTLIFKTVAYLTVKLKIIYEHELTKEINSLSQQKSNLNTQINELRDKIVENTETLKFATLINKSTIHY